ncbi:MAG TPA: ATP-binding protein [Terriglobales bacterium]|jgi:two-component system NtrC family sensor kinase|nr:ATP-binding protein [Terriglobales bacterium]
MPETDPTRSRWQRLTRSLSSKLITLLLVVLVGIFGLLGYLNIRLHRQHLENSVLGSAERVSDVIKRTTTYYMLRNDREGLYHVMQTIADEPGMVKLRIFDKEGRVSYSTDAAEVSHVVDKGAEACYGCHTQSQPLTRLNRPDRFRIYRSGGQRVLGIITPIENQPTCSNAACHAHPASQQILGVLDTNISLAKADAQLAASTRSMLFYTAGAMLIVAVLSWLFVWRVVGVPVKALKSGTERLAEGELGYQIEVQSKDEVGELAQSFNTMSLQLRTANEEIVAWAKTLEDRVDQKTHELKRAHDHVLHVEKMASIGKMAAVVAHEINNPLSGILTYAKLLRKWLDRGETEGDKHQEALQCLELIAGESRRCGDLVKNLLTFSRTAPMNVETTDLNAVIDRSVRLVQHQLELSGIQLQLDLTNDLPQVQCDPAQIEQVLLALIMNSIDAMPRGGNLWLRTRLQEPGDEVEIQVRDDGMGIPADILPQLFEPFLTTKESGHGVGLGLAISRGIIERHNGNIEVQSEVGKGTTFTITLPLEGGAVAANRGAAAATNVR